MSDVTNVTGSVEKPRPDGCLDRLQWAAERLKGARYRVVARILVDPWKVQGLSISALAAATGVSENAISRTTQTLGYSGYREFAQALALDLGKSLGYAHINPVDAMSAGGQPREGRSLAGPLRVIHDVLNMEIDSISDTVDNLSDPLLTRVVEALAGARHILLVGTGTAAALAQLFAYRLASLGIAATAASDPMVMMAEANRLDRDDLLVLISFSGRSRDSVLTAVHAKEHKVPVLALTTNTASPAARLSDLVVPIFSPKINAESAQFSGRVAGLALMEAIITAVSTERGEIEQSGLPELGQAQDRWNTLPEWWMP